MGYILLGIWLIPAFILLFTLEAEELFSSDFLALILLILIWPILGFLYIYDILKD